MISQPVEVASIILYQDKQFLMQRRENIPGILYPGSWVFFGGHVELGESPDSALKRERVKRSIRLMSDKTNKLILSVDNSNMVRYGAYVLR